MNLEIRLGRPGDYPEVTMVESDGTRNPMRVQNVEVVFNENGRSGPQRAELPILANCFLSMLAIGEANHMERLFYESYVEKPKG